MLETDNNGILLIIILLFILLSRLMEPCFIVGREWAEGTEAGPGTLQGDPPSPQQGPRVGETTVSRHPHRDHHSRVRVSFCSSHCLER